MSRLTAAAYLLQCSKYATPVRFRSDVRSGFDVARLKKHVLARLNNHDRRVAADAAAAASIDAAPYITFDKAPTTAVMFRLLMAATQIRPESKP